MGNRNCITECLSWVGIYDIANDIFQQNGVGCSDYVEYEDGTSGCWDTSELNWWQTFTADSCSVFCKIYSIFDEDKYKEEQLTFGLTSEQLMIVGGLAVVMFALK